MARFDVYPRPGRGPGFVVDVQAALLDHLATRTVLLLLPASIAPASFKELNPTFDIGGALHVLVTQTIATVMSKDLGKPVGSPSGHQDLIARALDILLTGY